MTDKDGDASSHRENLFGVLEIATVLSVTVLYEVAIFAFEPAVIALLTMAVLVLVVDDD